MRIGLVAPSDAALVWNLAKPFLEKSMPYSGGRYDIDAMYEQIRQGTQQLWMIADEDARNPIAAFTTRVIEYPRLKTLSCQFCGGHGVRDWAEQVDDLLNNIAREFGCTAIEMTGRKGWTRVLPSSWKEEFILYRREVTSAELPPPQSDEPPP